MNYLARLLFHLIFITLTLFFGFKTFEMAVKVMREAPKIERTPQSWTEFEKEPKHYHPSEFSTYLGKAVYKEFEIDKYLKRLEDRYIAKEYKPYIGYTGTVVRVVMERQIVFKWEF